MVYKWRSDSRKPGNAQAVGERLESLKGEQGIRPEDVVTAAETDPVLHPHFEWDDEKAAAAHRIDQARGLLRAIVIVQESGRSGESIEVRAFQSLSDNSDSGAMVYVPVMDAMNDAAMRRELLNRAYTEAQAWRLRYKNLMEFGEVFSAIDRVSV